MRTTTFLICLLSASPVWPADPRADQRKAQREFENGIRYEEAGQWQEAYYAFSASLAADTTGPAYLHRAKASLKLGSLQKAGDDLTWAIRLAPKDPETIRLYSSTLLERGESYGQRGDFDRAVEDLNGVLRVDPNSARALAFRGAAFAKLRDYPRAIEDFSTALKLTPGDHQLYLARSSVYTALGDYPRALTDRNEAVRLKPDSAEALLARGGTFHQMGLHEDGLADRGEAIRLKPDMPEAWLARGSALYLLGRYSEAIDDLNHALSLKPDDEEARGVLAKAEEAVAQAVAAQDLSPPVEPAPVEVAVVDAPKLPEAAPPAPTVDAKAAEADAEDHRRRGRELLYQGKYRDAIAELTEAVRQKADFALAYNARGFAYYLLRDYTSALADLDQAIRLNPKYLNAYQNRSRARKAAGDAAGSAADAAMLAKAREAVPQSGAAQNPPPPAQPAPLEVAVAKAGNVTVPTPPAEAHAEDHNRRGRELLSQGKYPAAIAELTEAIRQKADFALAYNARGFAYYLLREYTSALTDLDQAIRLSPKYVNAYQNRSRARKAAGDAPGGAADDAKVRELSKQ
jgi:tetratricopeptide (TPR) repeat protein